MFKKYTVAVALLAALTACSSSNDKPTTQNGGQATPPNQTQPNTGGNSGATGNASGSNHSTISVSYGGVHFFSKDGQNGYFTPVSDLEALTIDGNKFSLLLGKEHKKVKLENLSFGAHLAKSSENDYHIFAAGKLTSQMPTEGQATYSGKAFYGSEELQGMVDGTSSFTVDFANKTVNGQIQVNNRIINLLKADIKGNKFEAKRGAGKNEEWIKGHFFGEKAAELGGVWEKETNGQGEGAVFGATKQ